MRRRVFATRDPAGYGMWRQGRTRHLPKLLTCHDTSAELRAHSFDESGPYMTTPRQELTACGASLLRRLLWLSARTLLPNLSSGVPKDTRICN